MSDIIANAPKLRNARACEACRASKSRCIYKSQVGVCQRCEQSGSQCIVRAKARPMRTRAIRPSTAPQKSSSVVADSEFSINLPSVSSPDVSRDLEAFQHHHKGLFDDDDSPDLKSKEDNAPTTQTSDVVEQRKITLNDAEKLLDYYRIKAPFFPFVRIEKESTVRSLARTSPFLLLAILTSVSIKDPPLYHQMDHEFRRILSLKIIVEGQKSLDFLQGLLVYIAWYPLHINPKKNQSHMYLNLAISLSSDLGLDQELPNLNNFNAINTDGLAQSGAFTSAAKRAYLGCYYLSAAVSSDFQKPNNLKYNSSMEAHGQSLLQDGQAADIHNLVKLQHLREQIGELHLSNQPALDPQTESLNSEMNVQIILNELQEWSRTTPDSIRNLVIVGIAERCLPIYIYSHELGLLRRPYRIQLPSSRPPNASHLSGCLEACKKFFEYLLSLPESSYKHFTMVEWGKVVLTILVLSRLTFLMAATLGWDADTTRSNIPLVMYLDCLCYRFQELSSTPSDDTTPAKNPDVLYVFKMVLGSVKKSYERRVAKIEPGFFAIDHGTVVGVARGHCPMNDPTLNIFFDRTDSTYGSSFDLSGGSPSVAASTFPLYHDLWATMTCSWAEGF